MTKKRTSVFRGEDGFLPQFVFLSPDERLKALQRLKPENQAPELLRQIDLLSKDHAASLIKVVEHAREINALKAAATAVAEERREEKLAQADERQKWEAMYEDMNAKLRRSVDMVAHLEAELKKARAAQQALAELYASEQCISSEERRQKLMVSDVLVNGGPLSLLVERKVSIEKSE